MRSIHTIVNILFAVFSLCYFYQYIYILIAWFGNRNIKRNEQKNRFSVLICARNEETVIANCIESILAQRYPRELIKIYVVADNCTDRTAECAAAAGATVYKRFNKNDVGKGYALEFLFDSIERDDPDFADAYVVFDADNIVDGDFFNAMNDMLGEGYSVSTCYRNTKNFDDSLIAACSGLWFLRESKYLNHARMNINSGCAVSGTGFMIKKSYLRKIGGWHYHILIEDIQFTVECAIDNEKIGYCRKAIVYDEQPKKFSTSWKQRVRWCKGYFHILGRYGAKLFGKACRGSFTCFDMFMNLSPAYIISIVAQIVFVVGLIVSFFTGRTDYQEVIKSFGAMLGSAYIMLFIMGAITAATEWKQIHARWWYKLITIFVFPLYMATYLPINIYAIFSKPVWKPIEHMSTKSYKDFKNSNGNDNTENKPANQNRIINPGKRANKQS